MANNQPQETIELRGRDQACTTPTIAISNADMLSPGPSPSSTRPPSSSSGSMLSQQPSTQATSTPPSSVSSTDIANCSPEPQSRPQTSRASNTPVSTLQTSSSWHNSSRDSSQHGSPSSSPQSRTPDSVRRGTNLTLVEAVRDRVPDSLTTQNILAWSVVALTVATVVYSRRSDLSQRWNNLVEWYQYCNSSNYTVPYCEQIKDEPLGAPPFLDLSNTWNNIHKRRLNEKPTIDTDSGSDTAVTTSLITNLVVGILTVIAGYVLYEAVLYKRSGKVKQSDMSMARQDFAPVRSNSVPLPSSDGPQGPEKHGGRIRAFLTMEQAVKQMRHLTDDKPSLTDPGNRRSSNPYAKRLSGLPGDDESLYEHVDLYYHDPESTSSVWTKVRRASTDPKPPTKPDRNPMLPDPAAPSETHAHAPATHRVIKARAQRFTGKFRNLMDPKPIKIYDHPPPELAEGNIGAAIAFAGSITAATVGGTVMSRCPVEVTPDYGLPDSWMHMSPQDDSCALTPVSTNTV